MRVSCDRPDRDHLELRGVVMVSGRDPTKIGDLISYQPRWKRFTVAARKAGRA